MAQLAQVVALVGGQGIGPREMDQEQVILLQVVAKGRRLELPLPRERTKSCSI